MTSLRIAVCVKPVLDPEAPAQAFRIDPERNRPDGEGVPLVLDSYAAHALEVGLQVRARHPGSTLTVFCVGDDTADEVLRQCYALTCDRAVRCWDPGWADLDGLRIAHILARMIESEGGADLVLCGREAADIEEGLVPTALAEELGAACLTLVEKVDLDAGAREVQVTRTAGGRALTLAAPLPAVLSVTSTRDNVLRMPTVRDRMLAHRKKPQVLEAASLTLEAERLAVGARLAALAPVASDRTCRFIEGPDAAAVADRLIAALQEGKLI
ncbi:MAG TPA: hypothetical protein VF282_11940 [Bacillota bacterium]